jgi:hypothetical protein
MKYDMAWGNKNKPLDAFCRDTNLCILFSCAVLYASYTNAL